MGDMYFIAIARSGVFGQAFNKLGPSHPAMVSSYDTDLAAWYPKLRDGGFIIDKRPAFERDDLAATHEVIAGPMVNPTLTDDPEHIGALSYVTMPVYLARWRALGARIGERFGDNIIWETGGIEPVVTM